MYRLNSPLVNNMLSVFPSFGFDLYNSHNSVVLVTALLVFLF